MMAPHTMTHLRTEYFNGNGITDRKSREKWEAEGSLDMRQRALEKARQLVANPNPVYIPEDVDQAIRAKFNILL